MKQLLMSFLRCAALVRSGGRCSFRAKYGQFCGHHRTGKTLNDALKSLRPVNDGGSYTQ